MLKSNKTSRQRSQIFLKKGELSVFHSIRHLTSSSDVEELTSHFLCLFILLIYASDGETCQQQHDMASSHLEIFPAVEGCALVKDTLKLALQF